MKDDPAIRAARERADALEESGDLDGAIAALTTGIVETGDPKAWLVAFRGRLHHLKQEWPLAISDFDVVLQVRPNAATARYFRARARASIGELEGAQSDYLRVIELEPRAVDALYEIAIIACMKRDLRGAKQRLDEATRIDPDHRSVKGGFVGLIRDALQRLEQRDQLEAAIELATASILEGGGTALPLSADRGRLLCLMDSWQAAISDLDAFLQDRAGSDRPTKLIASCHFYRGRARSMVGDLDGATTDFRAVVAADPCATDALYEMALICEYRRRLVEAKTLLQKVVLIDRGYADAAERLRLIIERLQEPAPAHDPGPGSPSGRPRRKRRPTRPA